MFSYCCHASFISEKKLVTVAPDSWQQTQNYITLGENVAVKVLIVEMTKMAKSRMCLTKSALSDERKIAFWRQYHLEPIHVLSFRLMLCNFSTT